MLFPNIIVVKFDRLNFVQGSLFIIRCDSISQHLLLSVGESVWVSELVIDSFRLEISIASPSFEWNRYYYGKVWLTEFSSRTPLMWFIALLPAPLIRYCQQYAKLSTNQIIIIFPNFIFLVFKTHHLQSSSKTINHVSIDTTNIY